MTHTLDGGLATYLVQIGHKNIDNDPLWSARLLQTEPTAIYGAHKAFCDSGASVVITASYQASLQGFQDHLHVSAEEANQLIQKSVQLAERAASDSHQESRQQSTDSTAAEQQQRLHSSCLPDCPFIRRQAPLVAGSVGPYGACLHDGSEYTGSYIDTVSLESLKEWHRPRISSLVAAGSDFIALETIPAAKEGVALLEVMKEHPNSKTWISFSCQDGKSYECPAKTDPRKTCYGDNWADVVIDIVEKFYPTNQLVGVGINCTAPASITPLLQSLKDHPRSARVMDPGVALIVYANSGEEWQPGVGFYNKDKCDNVFDFADEWLRLGVTWLGGCCRVFPDDIAELHKKMFLNR